MQFGAQINVQPFFYYYSYHQEWLPLHFTRWTETRRVVKTIICMQRKDGWMDGWRI
jgi:hypothetical protein